LHRPGRSIILKLPFTHRGGLRRARRPWTIGRIAPVRRSRMNVSPALPVLDLVGSCLELGSDGDAVLKGVRCPVFAQLFETVPVGVAMVDRSDRVVMANSAFCRLFGYDAAELAGSPLDELTVPDFLVQEASSLARSALHRAAAAETLRRRHDGSLVEVAVQRTPLIVAGRAVGQLVVFQDITERKRSESERHEWLARARSTAETAGLEPEGNAHVLAAARAVLEAEHALHGPDGGFARLARLLVPELADSCIVYLREGENRVRRVAVAFADASQEELLREQLSHYPPDLDHLIPPVARVLETGQAELIPEVSISALKAVPGDREHVSVALLVGLTSLLIVPLSLGGRVIGAISLAIADSDRRFRAEDLLVLEEIARCAAGAVADEDPPATP